MPVFRRPMNGENAMEPALFAAIYRNQGQLQDQEEEAMTRYTIDELQNDWEFKIVRATDQRFRDPVVLQQLMDDESIAGWQMLEKLDNNRVRFKRRISESRSDYLLPSDVDPYRTQIGRTASDQEKIILVVGAVVAVLLAGIAVFLLLL